MLKSTNKILITLVSILILLLIIAVVLFSIVIKNTSKEEENKATAMAENTLNLIDIEQVEKNQNVLVAYLGENNLDGSVIEIGTDKINNVVENNLAPYYIKVNVQTNTITIYKKDGNGNYNIPLKAMICSCGSETPVEGTFSLKKYNNWQWKTISGRQYVQYASQISGDILLQSVPYTVKGAKSSLNYEEYDKLGTFSTQSSISLQVIDAKWIYENCPAGTQITFYTEETPGPLGKPTSQLITEDEQVRGWDPTDPEENNPWKNYVRPEKKEEDNQTNNNVLNENILNQNTVNENTLNNDMQNNNNLNNTLDNNNLNNNNLNNNTLNDNNVGNLVNSNTVDNNNLNNNEVNNNQTNNNRVPENRVLEENDDVVIKSEVIDTNTL